MTEFPPLTHVALTVRDLTVSVPWYSELFDAEPVLDEDTDPDFHHTVFLLGRQPHDGATPNRKLPSVIKVLAHIERDLTTWLRLH